MTKSEFEQMRFGVGMMFDLTNDSLPFSEAGPYEAKSVDFVNGKIGLAINRGRLYVEIHYSQVEVVK